MNQNMSLPTTDKPILVTGATGYVAGRLIPSLLDSGYRVRAMGRSLDKLSCRPWASHPKTELAAGDVLDPASLRQCTQGCGCIYYLVHSMIARKGRYAEADRIGARNMAAAAAAAGADQIIYLGGLGNIHNPRISPHLLSRHEVGEILASGPVPVTVLRAAMILGSGSASFEILRYLTERLPVMITPRWVSIPTQPIAITDIVGYLAGCLERPETRGRAFDIGGPDILSYKDLVQIFAQEAGLAPRRILPVPVLTPGLSARWIHLVTPVPASIAQPLTEGLSVPTTCTETSIRQIIPLELTTCRHAIRTAIQRIRQEQIDTCWTDAGAVLPPEWAHCGDAGYAGGTILECGYRAVFNGTPESVWPAIISLGGTTGYYAGNALWRLRGMIDRLAGGVGLGRGRRFKETLRVGDALDFWRVLEVDPPSKLLLLAEMKTPGEALLGIELANAGDNRCEVTLHSRFLPKGLAGILYWYVLYPFHLYIFSGMLAGFANASNLTLSQRPQRFTPKITPTCRLR